MIYVLATVELEPGRREEFLREFHLVAKQVRQEEGCLFYEPTADAATPIAAQIPRRPDVVTIVEKWTSLAALEAHLTAPHMQAYRPRVKHLVKKVSLQVLEPV